MSEEVVKRGRGRPPKNSLVEIIRKDETMVECKEILHKVFTITRFGKPNPGINLFDARDVERQLNAFFAEGWKLFSVSFTGMEDALDQKDAGFRVLYILVR